jgi:hypothetical protein
MLYLGVASWLSTATRRQLRSARTLVAAKKLIGYIPARGHESTRGVCSVEKKYQTRGAEDLDASLLIVFLKALRTEASRHLRIRGSQPPDFIPLCPQSCHAWHGYRVTIAYHEEVGVSADGLASAPPSGAAGAVPPAGANPL